MATPSLTAPQSLTAPDSLTVPDSLTAPAAEPACAPAVAAPAATLALTPPVEAAPYGRALDHHDLESLLATLRLASDRARHTGRPTLASWAKPLSLGSAVDIWQRARLHTTRSLLWQSAWDGGSVVAFGSAHDLDGHGADRVDSVRAGWTELVRDPVCGGAADPSTASGEGPLAIGGFAFAAADPRGSRLPDALMWVPALQIRGLTPARGAAEAPARAELRLNAALSPDDDPEQRAKELAALADTCLLWEPEPAWDLPTAPAGRAHTAVELPAAEDWKELVRRATGRIRAGGFEKVVLARELRVTASTPFDVPDAVRRLRTANPGTTVFAVDHDGCTFLGATPEYLVRVEDRTVHALGLAGTTPRGATPEQDEAHERELVDSPKIQHEHDVVVQMLRDALGDSCADVDAETPPRVVKLANVQHLSTKVHGRLAEDSPAGILDLVERLHPTPALGGHPREAALSWLADNEGLDRSWYAGAVGWADRTGQGQFAVAIRSALLDGATASLYAGCGLVADSDPEAEYAETCAKLRPMLHALDIE
ncbi:isochorismate synthase [Streptomyces sp. H27-G5]|uniref:isochorismate synthase n=1 Tax=Streptomyces sp. H27-G5 TaxID=2996698 RepID=UPI00226E6AC2|nr:isochorismate synthase [Streptomyces sp. H27-G5]MCY0917385.1 isochorismate synthase [Streptomyces sp. H27-G5]